MTTWRARHTGLHRWFEQVRVVEQEWIGFAICVCQTSICGFVFGAVGAAVDLD